MAQMLGLASELKTFPDNEVRKGALNMKLKALNKERETIAWAKDSNDLPVLTWDEFQKEHKESGRKLIAIGGFIHDVTDFLEGDQHPGGYGIIRHRLGRDATAAFNGGVYDHSNAAHNLLSMMRVGVLDGGMEVEASKLKPSIVCYDGPSTLPQPILETDKLNMSTALRHDSTAPEDAVAACEPQVA